MLSEILTYLIHSRIDRSNIVPTLGFEPRTSHTLGCCLTYCAIYHIRLGGRGALSYAFFKCCTANINNNKDSKYRRIYPTVSECLIPIRSYSMKLRCFILLCWSILTRTNFCRWDKYFKHFVHLQKPMPWYHWIDISIGRKYHYHWIFWIALW